MKRLMLLLLSVVLALLMATGAWADIYSGAISNRTDGSGTGTLLDTEGGLSAVGNAWADSGNNLVNKGVRLEWSVNYNATSQIWTYTYTCLLGTGNKQAAYNFDIETAQNFTASNLVSWKVTDLSGNVETDPAGPGTFLGTEAPALQTGSVGSGTQMTLFGYNWSFPLGFGLTNGTNADGNTVTIQTTRAPMWGDILLVEQYQQWRLRRLGFSVRSPKHRPSRQRQ